VLRYRARLIPSELGPMCCLGRLRIRRDGPGPTSPAHRPAACGGEGHPREPGRYAGSSHRFAREFSAARKVGGGCSPLRGRRRDVGRRALLGDARTCRARRCRNAVELQGHAAGEIPVLALGGGTGRRPDRDPRAGVIPVTSTPQRAAGP